MKNFGITVNWDGLATLLGTTKDKVRAIKLKQTKKYMTNKSEIRNQVEEFMLAAGQAIQDKPAVPSEKIVRLRASLIAEEAFEFLEATYGKVFDEVKFTVRDMIANKSLNVDIVEIADAAADLDYVVEGARLAYGINGKEIADEVQRTNMAKFGPGSYKRDDGKLMKPPGWQAPDIKILLIDQGYEIE